MKALVINDEQDIAKEIIDCLKIYKFVCDQADNEEDAKRIVKSRIYDLIVLDMTIPLTKWKSSKLNSFGGIRILDTMKVNKIYTPVIVVTQFWDFVSLERRLDDRTVWYYSNPNWGKESFKAFFQSNDIQYLDRLHEFMSGRFMNYVGSVYYSKMNTVWTDSLGKMIKCIWEEL